MTSARLGAMLPLSSTTISDGDRNIRVRELRDLSQLTVLEDFESLLTKRSDKSAFRCLDADVQ